MSVKEGVKIKNYQFVAPDGGWGYVIWIAVIINLIATSSFVGCFGIIFKDLFIQLEMGSTSVTLLNGVTAMCVAISGFVTGPLLKFISMRQLGLLAVIVFNLGSIGLVFVNSIPVFFLCQGIFQSLGVGALYNISFSIINDYFVKRRLLTISLVQSVAASVALFSPQLVNIIIENYGFRGTLFFLAAINMHTFVSVILMQPVDWHLKRVEVQNLEENETILLMVENKSSPDEHIVKLSDKEIESNKYTGKNGEKDLELDSERVEKRTIKEIIFEAVDLSLMRSFLLTNAALGMALCSFADLTFSLILPQTLYAMKWSESDVASAISLNNLGDLVTRILFIFLNSLLSRFETQYIYIVGLFVAVIGRIGMLGSENFTVILSFLTVLGSARCIIFMLMPLVIAEAVQPEQFTSAMGIFMMVYGLINLLLGPVIGAVRDLTDSYPTAIYILTSCFAIVIIFWIVEICYKKNKHKRKARTFTAEKR
ncbi:unnamed protein product, partial [Iphiclides podalirius]